MTDINPMLLTDGYKLSHRSMYPENTTTVYSNLTARKSRVPNVNDIIFFGLQYYIKKYLIEYFDENFFDKEKHEVVASYRRIVDSYLGKNAVSTDSIEALHDLGYLPLHIKALPEGSLVPIGVPCMTIVNTKPEFYWVTNFVESHLSDTIWGPCTSARTAFEYLKILNKYANETTGSTDGVEWQAHDFSLRGMFGLEAAMMSGAAHLLSFNGTDSIPSLWFLEKYYNADCDIELVGASVPASEHSISCSYGKDNEQECFRRLLVDVYPHGIVSLVSDTWNLWNVLTVILPNLKTEILARKGKCVVRPDSGSPVHILCGYTKEELAEPNELFSAEVEREGLEHYTSKCKGVVEVLWDQFGGTINEQGYKVLNPCVGAIYGDSITIDRCREICQRLKDKGFASTNVVLGVGSYSYQYVTRDTFGFAIKSTYCEISGVPQEIFKDPLTDSGMKKSLKGLLWVYRDEDGIMKVKDQATKQEEEYGLLQTVFKDSSLIRNQTLESIRDIVEQESINVQS